MGFTFNINPDFGVWTRAVERVIDTLDLDFWPAEEVVNQIITDCNLTDPETQMETLEEELMAAYE